MRKLVLLFLGVSLAALGQTAQTTIADRLTIAINGQPAVGAMSIAWGSFREPDGTIVPSGSQSVNLTNGSFSVSLYPTSTATPTDGGSEPVFYTVSYSLTSGSTLQEQWSVPQSGATLKISNVLVAVPPELQTPSGSTVPASCNFGDLFLTGDQTLHLCISTNTWTAIETGAQASALFLPRPSGAGVVYFDGTTSRPSTLNDLVNTMGYTPVNPANNLSEYAATASAARTNLGLGSAATHPATDFASASAVGAANGIATLDSTGKVPVAQIPSLSALGIGTAGTEPSSYFLQASQLNAASGVAPLDSNKLVPLANIPAIPYSSLANTPTIPTKVSQLTNDSAFVNAAQAAAAAPVQSVTIAGGTPQTGAVSLALPTATSSTPGVIQVGNDLLISSGILSVNASAFDAAGAATAANANALQKSANLSDLGSASIAKTNLGLSPLATSGAWADIVNKPAMGDIISHNAADFLSSALLGANSGVATLDTNGKLTTTQIPSISVADVTGLGTAAVEPTNYFLLASQLNAASGVAPLDSNKLLPLANLPAIPYSSLSGTPTLAPVATSGQYSDLTGVPTALPPDGAAAGDLGGNYPNPKVVALNGQNIAALGAGILAVNSSGIPALATGSQVTAALGYTPLNAALNLQDLTNPAAARTNLGLGSAATASASSFLGKALSEGFVYQNADGTTRDAAQGDVNALIGFTPLNSALLGANSGIATLDNTGKLTGSQLPAVPFSDVTGVPSYLLASAVGTTVAPLVSGQVPASYLPTPALATATTPGIVQPGTDLLISNGTISVDATKFDAAGAAAGTLKAANNLSDLASITTAKSNLGLAAVASSGAYNDLSGKPTLATVATTGSYTDLINKPTIPPAYTLPAATNSTLGGVICGANLTCAVDGTISAAAPYSLPQATGSVLGGVKIGSDLLMNNSTGVLSVDASQFDAAGAATAAGAAALQKANNLSDLASVSAAKTNLGLATVASSGSYADLLNTPTLGTAASHAATDFVLSSALGAASGVATLDSSARLTASQLPTAIPVADISGLGTAATEPSSYFLLASQLNSASGVAPLDANKLLPLANLPTIPYSSISGTPALATVATTGSYNDLLNKPTGFPPIGAAGGDLAGTYPNPTVAGINGQNIAALGAGIVALNSSGVPHIATGTEVQNAFGYTPLNASLNLSDLASASTARTNLGLGTMATQNASAYLQTVGSQGFVYENANGTTADATQGELIALLGYTPVNPSSLGADNGIATLDGSGKLTASQLPSVPFTDVTGVPSYVLTSEVGAANGVAELDSNSKVPAVEIPAQPYATTSTAGEIIVGSDLLVSNGVLSVDASKFDASGAAASATASALQKANNLSDLQSASAARANLGLSTLAATGNWSDIVGKPTFAAVATSGSYADLIDTPTIPTKTSQLTNDSGFLTTGTLPVATTSGLGVVQVGSYLGVTGGGLLSVNVGSAANTVAAGNDPRITGALQSTQLNAANGVAGLDGSSKLIASELPTIPATDISGLGTAAFQNTSYFVLTSQLGAALGAAQLDLNGKVQLNEIPQDIPYSYITGGPTQYVLPAATASVLGGVMVGTGLSATSGGLLSVQFGTGANQALNGSLFGAPNGIAELNASSQVPVAELPIGVANGIAGLNASAQINYTELPPAETLTPGVVSIPSTSGLSVNGSGVLTVNCGTDSTQSETLCASSYGKPSGVAELDTTGLVPTSELPTLGEVTAKQWSQSPGGSIGPGANTVTLSPCPVGVNGSDGNLSLYLSGGGGSETVTVTGGTCTSGASTGTVSFNNGGSYSGGWTIGSATAGIYEAIVGNPGRKVYMPAGHYVMHACIYLPNYQQSLYLEGDTNDIAAAYGPQHLTDATLLDFSALTCDGITVTNSAVNTITFKDFGMMGNSNVSSGGNGVVITNSVRTTFDNMFITRFSKNCIVEQSGSYEFLIENHSFITQCGQWGVYATQTQNISTIRDSFINANSEAGNFGNVYIDGAGGASWTSIVTIKDTDMEQAGIVPFSGANVTSTIGLHVGDATTVVVEGDYFEDNVGTVNVEYTPNVNGIYEVNNWFSDGYINYDNVSDVKSYNNTFAYWTGGGCGGNCSGGRSISVSDVWGYELGPDMYVDGADSSQEYGTGQTALFGSNKTQGFFNYTGVTSGDQSNQWLCSGQTCAPGIYRISVFAKITQANSGGNLHIHVYDTGGNFDFGNGASGSPADLPSNALGSVGGSVVVHLDGTHNPAFEAIEQSGSGGNPTFNVYAVLERLTHD